MICWDRQTYLIQYHFIPKPIFPSETCMNCLAIQGLSWLLTKIMSRLFLSFDHIQFLGFQAIALILCGRLNLHFHFYQWIWFIWVSCLCVFNLNWVLLHLGCFFYSNLFKGSSTWTHAVSKLKMVIFGLRPPGGMLLCLWCLYLCTFTSKIQKFM